MRRNAVADILKLERDEIGTLLHPLFFQVAQSEFGSEKDSHDEQNQRDRDGNDKDFEVGNLLLAGSNHHIAMQQSGVLGVAHLVFRDEIGIGGVFYRIAP